ncbi:MAG: hypothetical protein JXP73_03715 [Deltaproteobacteria bacterium]|nr:hypothetical protein [Deltaproteobacteria bacterium]
MRRSLLGLLAASVVLRTAQAEATEACGDENLLAGRQPTHWLDVYRPEMMTDGIGARDGDPEMGSRSAVLGSDAANLEWDLGAQRRVTAVLLQAGASARYRIELSPDGQAWSPLVEAAPLGGPGLRTRVAKRLGGRGRYLRLSARGQSRARAVAELQIFCRPPAAPPLRIRAAETLSTPEAAALAQAWRGLVLLLPAGLALLLLLSHRPSPTRDRLCLAAAAGACLVALTFAASDLTLGAAATWGGIAAGAAALVALFRPRRGTAPAPPRLRCMSAALLVGLAAMAYSNYGRFAGYWSVHYHDVLHYLLGAKYAPELRYDGLYACLLEANAGQRRWTSVMPAAVRDLRDGRMVRTAETLARRPCRERFTAERWQAFGQDAAFFTGQLSPAGWVAVFADHGYNATPVWTWLWRPLFGAKTASIRQLERLAHVDEAACLAMGLLAIWAWGPAGAAAALLFGLGWPWTYLWTGGGVGRSLWLVGLVAGLACAARRRFTIAGVALGFSSAVQLFPTLILAGPLWLAWRRTGGADFAMARRMVLAASVAGSALVLLSFQTAGPSLWVDFARNTARHLASDSVNRIGSSVVATGFGLPRQFGWCLSAATLAVWAWAASRAGDVARLLSLAVLVPVFALRLSSYYLAVVVGLAPLLDSPGRVGAALLTLLAVPQLLAWTTRGVPGPGGYAWMSAAIVACGVVLCVLEARRPRKVDRDG